MSISRERLASIAIRYFTKIKNMSYYAVADIAMSDQKSIKAWEKMKRENMRTSSLTSLISKLEDNIKEDYAGFSEFLFQELENDGISRDYVKDIVFNSTDVPNVFLELQKVDLSIPLPYQERLGTAGIVQDVKSFLSPYREYFQINDKYLGENDNEDYFSSLIYNPKFSETSDSSVKELNYIVIKFPNAYHVGIILSNYAIDYSDGKQRADFSLKIGKLKSQHDLDMLIIVTDIHRKSIPLSVQATFMEQYNLFFEFVKPSALNDISIQALKITDNDVPNIVNRIDQYRYAQLIYERFMSYLAVISNEIVFLPFLDKLHKELDSDDRRKVNERLNKMLVSYQKRTNINNFNTYAGDLLLKDICSYSYLSRHTIYHERSLVEETLSEFLKKEKITKISLAVEICAPNSLITVNVLGKCEKVLLFTASHTAYSVMERLDKKTQHRFLPQHVSLKLSHFNPEYIMNQYPEEFSGKIDLLVIGFGSGSQISDLTTFLRYAYNWLSEKGILFISVYNKEAIILNKNHLRDQRFESSPLYISDYWTYTHNGRSPLLKKLKSYSPEEFQSTYLSLFDTRDEDLSTYPYLSALINPTEYDRAILDEIRTADKLFAKQGIHGQLINVIGHKNKSRLAKESIDIVKTYLSTEKIPHQIFSHMLAPDSRSLRRSLQAQNVFMTNSTVLKTVILQEVSNKKRWHFAILPYDQKVVYDQDKYELLPETSVIKRYHQGTISPLEVIAETITKKHSFDNVYLQYNDKLTTEYVIMGCGSNTESVQMRTATFRKIITKNNITVSGFLE